MGQTSPELRDLLDSRELLVLEGGKLKAKEKPKPPTQTPQPATESVDLPSRHWD